MPDRSHDYEGLMWAESADLETLIDELDDTDFDAPSLCGGWRVRDVMSHMILGHTTPMPRMIALIGRYGFNVPRASLQGSAAYGSAHSPDEIRAAWHGVVDGHTRRGIAKRVSATESFVDHLIHQQDIRRPLGRPRAISEERLLAALDAMPRLGGFVKSKKRMDGLRWTATDVDWTYGSGPEMTGPAEALVLLASGRPAPLGEVTGDGRAHLKGRLTPG